MSRSYRTTRRRFLKQSAVAALASTLPARSLFAADEQAPAPAVKDRAPLHSSTFFALPLGSVRPAGWLRRQLEIQASGLSGHLDETWADVGPNSGWLGGTGESWERGPYFLDGLVPLAYLLDDARLKAKAQKYIDWILTHPAPNGMIGPASNDDWWPRIVALKALTQYQEFTGDPRVVPLMDRYFRHQLGELPKRPLRDWGKFRWQDEALSVIWLYNRTGSPYLLDLARLLHQQGYNWIGEISDFPYKQKITADYIKLNEGGGLKDLALATHGVNNGQAIKTGAIWSLVSGSDTDRKATGQMIAELDRYHGLPNGMFSCDEHLSGRDPSQGSELCTVVEYMFSLERALAITGDAAFGDRLERLAFNALPGTLTDDMWAHQYNQEPNQVECSLHHKPWVSDGPESNLFGLEPNFGCCTANFHQGWPKFAASLFLLSGDPNSDQHDGIVAAAYAPCEVRTSIRGTAIHIVEETSYPFRGTIKLTINPASAVAFPLHLRIPAWAAGTVTAINGKPEPEPQPGSFARLDRTWKSGDRVEITFPMQPRTSRWFNDSIAMERGPLVFSYGIGESWVKLRDRGMTADWQVYPTTSWNYAVKLKPDNPTADIKVSESEIGDTPFARKTAPVQLSVKARKLPVWRAEDGAADALPQSPVTSDAAEEDITLIPYASAKLRITAFPLLKA
ncbi:beta-L-arabinofuranosidase domain-containing protein [Occallatibacter savannae]|uniref:beta-L-arabinofuranosidase domain-containing protein n=1 Tax=Occallatibacter savannae TaxID=1002691 RepID=UPI000D691240|nr:beta-L-arabinofuranosidase domain-containing protein [Occallatibacter savannae]